MTTTAAFDLDSLSHRGDPDTSRDAAKSQEKKLSEMHEVILGIFRDHPEGLTSDQLAIIYRDNQAAQGWPEALEATPIKRKSDLANLGKLVMTDERRLNRHNFFEAVWVLA